MKQRFVSKRFSEKSVAMIALANQIIEQYQAQGLRLTLRQLYYQLVTRNAISNQERSYKNLSTLLSDARLAGLVDWAAIEDRVRLPRAQSEWDGLGSLVETALEAYRLPRWQDQPTYCELWVEKDALAGVLSPLAANHHITMMVNRGYSSQSAMYDAADRFRVHGGGKEKIVFYLGDHDPSGEDMVRDIQDRFIMFGVDVDVRKLALTMDQVDQYNPPPNPAKVSDPRATAYISRYGDESWEVDALPPDVLADIINGAVESVVDQTILQEILTREEHDKADLWKRWLILRRAATEENGHC